MPNQAIQTKFLGPTNTRAPRVKASCEAGSITINWDHMLDTDKNHERAIIALIIALGWNDRYIWSTGWLGESMVAVSRYSLDRASQHHLDTNLANFDTGLLAKFKPYHSK